MNKKWQSLIDQQVEQMFQETKPTDLPGAGKPLNMEDDSRTPRESRMAHKIMRDNDLAPTWVMMRQDIEKEVVGIREAVDRAWRNYRTRVADARRQNSILLEDNADQSWERQITGFRRRIDTVNRKVLDYNLQVPPGIPHMKAMNWNEERARLTG